MNLTDFLNRVVSRGTQDNRKKIIEQFMDHAQAWKPHGYDTEMIRRRDYYEGNGSRWMVEALKKRYPATWSDMDIVNLNYLKLIADNDAAVYDYGATRRLLVNDEMLDLDSDMQRHYEQMLRQSNLDVVLSEAERRVMVCNTIFMNIEWSIDLDAPQVKIFYPQDINVIPNPANPQSLQDSYGMMVKTVSPNGLTDTTQYYIFYYREVVDGELGPWFAELVNDEGFASQIYPENRLPYTQLPWVVWRNGYADSTMFRDADNDLIDSIDAININQTNLNFILDMQAHSTLAYEGDSREDLVGGPGKVISFAPGERLSVLDYNPKISELEQVNVNLVKTLAATRRQSPDAYSIHRKAPESGIARQISNLPYMKALKERQHFAREMEMDLYKVYAEVHNAFHESTAIPLENGSIRFTPNDEPEIQDPQVHMQKVMAGLTNELITKSRAAVELGFYQDETEAMEAIGAQTEQQEQATSDFAERLRLAAGN